MIPLHRQRLWLLAALLLTALKLWLTRGQGVLAVDGVAEEDRLAIQLAQHLARGGWLERNEFVLDMGPFYPLFIAIAFWIGVPLLLAQHLFYATACGLFAQALRPAIASPGIRLAIYLLLLANPMSYDGPSMARVIPQQVHTALALMVFASLVALYLRRTGPPRRQAPWALALGLAATGFWLTGEDIAWFVPSVLLLAGACWFGAKQISPAALQGTARWLGAAAVIALLPALAVGIKNKRDYDLFATGKSRTARFDSLGGSATTPSLWRVVDFVASFSRFSARVPPSTGTEEQLQLFRDITHERLSPPVDQLDKVGAARYILNGGKVENLQRIGKALRPVLTTLFWLTLGLWLVRTTGNAWRRRWNFPLTVAAAAGLATAIFIVTHTRAGLVVAAFAPVYPLLLVFIVATLWEAGAAWERGRAAKESAGT